MAKNFLLKIKTIEGVKQIDHLTSKSSFDDLRVAISQLVNFDQRAVGILHGFPPRKLDVPDSGVSLENLRICHGDCLQVEAISAVEARTDSDCEKQESTAKLETVPNLSSSYLEWCTANSGQLPMVARLGDPCWQSRDDAHMTRKQNEMSRGILTRHTVPADNSCLFTSIDYVLNGGSCSELAGKATSAKSMRQLVAETIAADPVLYNTAVLDNKQNAEYCCWIQDESSWGGAIELNILSSHFGVEIDVVNTQDGRIDRFGEVANYKDRVLLVYDGIHYDPLELESVDGSSPTTVFSTDDDEILSQALELGHEAKSSRQFTDVGKFRLICLQCRVIVTGQTGAVEHTKITGHVQFGEI